MRCIGRYIVQAEIDGDCSSASYDGNGQERERQARHVLPEIEVSKTLHRLSPSKQALSCEAERDAKAVQQMIRTATGFPLSQRRRSEEHTSELQSLMRISYAVFCLKKNTKK